MNKELVSIIITTYKGIETIEYAVLSALNQSYKNTEIIVVDDNGINTDCQEKTRKILKDYIDSKKIKYYAHKKNMNGSSARNTGVRLSNGKYVTFLDDDDIYLSNKVENELRYLKKTQSSMVICGGFFVNRNGRGYRTVFRNNNELLKDYLTEKVLFNTSTFMIDKCSFNKISGFDESFKRHQDWEFFTRAYTNFKVEILNELLVVKYRFERNVASNPKIAENYLNHFIEKRKSDIISYSSEFYEKIYEYQQLRIAKLYYSINDLTNFRRVMRKTNYKFYNNVIFKENLKHLFNKLINGTKKRYMSYDEMANGMKLLKNNILY